MTQEGSSRVVRHDDPHVGRGLVRRLVLLRLRPRGGVGRGERAERGREHEQESGPRVAERASRELARADRRDEAAAPREDPLRDLGDSRDDAGRHDPAGEQSHARGCDEQRVEAEHAPGVLGQRRAVQPELPEADHSEDDQDEIDAEALGERSADLARQPRADAGRVAGRGERRQGQGDDTGTGRQPRHDHDAAIDPRRRGDPGISEGPDRPQQADDADRQPRGDEGCRNGEHQRLAERHCRQVGRARAARSEERAFDPPPLDEHARDEDDRVGGENRELDGQEHDAAPADERRAIDAGEDRRQLRRNAQRAARQACIGQAGLEGLEVRLERGQAVDPQALDGGNRPPFEVELADRDASDEVLAREDDRPARREGPARLHPIELEGIRHPVRIVTVGPPGADDGHLDTEARIVAADQRDPVGVAHSKRLCCALRENRLEGRLAGDRPAAGHELGVAVDRAVAGQASQAAWVIGIEACPDEPARSDDEPDLATAGTENLAGLVRHDLVHRPDVGRRRRRADQDDPTGRRRLEDRPPHATEGDDVAVDGAGGEENGGAEEQQSGRQHHRPVRPASVQQSAPEAGRTEQGCRRSSRIVASRPPPGDTPADPRRFTAAPAPSIGPGHCERDAESA